MSEEPPPSEDLSREQFDERLRALNARRDAERAENERTSGSGDWGMAVKLSSEFIAAILVGAALGFGFDYLLGTSPWGLIVLFMLGFGAAVLNVMRAVGRAPASKLNVRALDEAAPDADRDRSDPTG